MLDRPERVPARTARRPPPARSCAGTRGARCRVPRPRHGDLVEQGELHGAPCLDDRTRVEWRTRRWVDCDGKVVLVTGAASGIGRATRRAAARRGRGRRRRRPRDRRPPTRRAWTTSHDVTDEARGRGAGRGRGRAGTAASTAWSTRPASPAAGRAPARRRRVGPGDRRQPHRHVPRLPSTRSASMVEQEPVDGERGSIVTIASIEGLEGTAGGSAYNASKGGVVLLTKNIAIDYGPLGHPRQRHLPRLHRHADDRGVFGMPRAWRSAPSSSRGAQAPPLRPARGDRRGGRVPAVGRRVVRDRPGHRRRRRLHRRPRPRHHQAARHELTRGALMKSH